VAPVGLLGEANAAAFEPLRRARMETGVRPDDGTLNGALLNGGSWQDAYLPAEADTTLTTTTLATRLVMGSCAPASGQVSLTPLAYDLTRWMSSRVLRSRAISHAREGRVSRLHVNQQYQKGTAIGRASSRGTPNTILAFSITYATATGTLSADRVLIARDACGLACVSEAHSTGASDQQHSTQGQVLGEARLVGSPDVIKASGIRWAYAQGSAEGASEIPATEAVRWPVVMGVRLPAEANLTVTQLIARAMRGRAEGDGASLTDPLEAIVTHTVWVRGTLPAQGAALMFEPTVLRKVVGQAQASGASQGTPWHWTAVMAEGDATGVADSLGENPRILSWVAGAGNTYAEALATDTAYKQAYVAGDASISVGATMGEAAEVTRRMQGQRVLSQAVLQPALNQVTRRTTAYPALGTAGTVGVGRNATVAFVAEGLLGAGTLQLTWANKAGMTGARLLRWTPVDHLEPARSEGGASRNVFKINAGEPAPETRTLFVPYLDRSLLLPADSREYRV